MAGEGDVLTRADALEVAHQVLVPAREHVLPVVGDVVDLGLRDGDGATPERSAPLEQRHTMPRLGEPDGRSQSRESTADDDAVHVRCLPSVPLGP